MCDVLEDLIFVEKLFLALLDLFNFLTDLAFEAFTLRNFVLICLVLKLMERALPVLRGDSDFLIELHHVRHLILQTHQLLLKVFDLHLKIVHAGLTILNNHL